MDAPQIFIATITSEDYGGFVLEILPEHQVNNSDNSTSFIENFVIEAPQVKLRGLGNISGVVINSNGNPVEGITVTIENLEENGYSGYFSSGVTDAGGVYSLTTLFYEGQESISIHVSNFDNDTVIVEVLPSHQVNNTGGQDIPPIVPTTFIDGFISLAPQIIFQIDNTAPVANSGSYQIVTQ